MKKSLSIPIEPDHVFVHEGDSRHPGHSGPHDALLDFRCSVAVFVHPAPIYPALITVVPSSVYRTEKTGYLRFVRRHQQNKAGWYWLRISPGSGSTATFAR